MGFNNMQEQKWLMLCDVDGTLDYRCAGIGGKVEKGAQRFVAAGGNLGLATGRAIISTEKIAKRLHVNSISILYGGAMLYDFLKRRIAWTSPLHQELLFVAHKIIRNYPDVCTMAYTDEGIYMLNSNDMVFEKGIKEECDPKNVDKNVAGNLLKLNLCGERDRVEQIKKEYFDGMDVNFSFSSFHFAEVVSDSAGKGKAMEILSDIAKIPLERFIAMGDGQNDLDMLKKAGIAFTLENAANNIKEVSDRVLPHCETGGAAEGFLLAERLLKTQTL